MEEICKKIMRAVGVAYFDGEDVFENGMGQVLLMVLDEQRRRRVQQEQTYYAVGAYDLPKDKFYVEIPGDNYGNTHYGFRVVKGRVVNVKDPFSGRCNILHIAEPLDVAMAWWCGVRPEIFIECDGPARSLSLKEHRALTKGHGCEVTKGLPENKEDQ